MIENLPGYPDNINRASDGNYWLAMVGMRSPGARPRAGACRASASAWPSACRATSGCSPTSTPAACCKFNEKGEILETLWDMAGVNHPMITSMREHKGYLYLGGIMNNRIGRYKLAAPIRTSSSTSSAGEGRRMIAALRQSATRLLGRGEASITMPMFDGALKPNHDAGRRRGRRRARRRRTIIAADGDGISGRRRRRASLRLDGGESARWRSASTAPSLRSLCLPGGGIAVALDGRTCASNGGALDGRRWKRPATRRSTPSNAIAVDGDGTLLVTDGSPQQPRRPLGARPDGAAAPAAG